MPVDPALAEAALLAAADALPGARPDGWAPSVQGAVGHVLGVRDGDGAGYVLKLFGGAGAERSAVESAALAILADVPDLPAPRLVATGRTVGVDWLLMTRLAGVRWADRFGDLQPADTAALIGQTARALHRWHAVPGPWFGNLLGPGPGGRSGWDEAAGELDEQLGLFGGFGGDDALADRIVRFVTDRRAALADCRDPVLCHHDANNANLLVSADARAVLTGIVDWERARWGDPLGDVARTKRHLAFPDESGGETLAAAYGVTGADQRARLRVHEVLYTLREWNWISFDRPGGWPGSLDRLDRLLRSWV